LAIRIYNTLTRKKEQLVTRDPGKVAMYVCGINTYDYCHMGHARSFVVYDVMRRYLEFSGYEVTHVTNFTDIEDNILQRARENNEDWRAMGERFVAAYFEDVDALGIKRAHHYPRATEYIPQMIELIQRLQDQGMTFILVEHVMHIIMELCERIVVLNFGQKIAEGTPEEIANNEQVIEAYLGKEGEAVA